uniref:Immunoglobulin subtype domain-containing protein n=1 Tax=Electrophorus electricus TaxID=8005 RepID=A0AAY5EH91_ELEEL
PSLNHLLLFEVGSSVQLHIKGSIKPFKTLKWMHGRYFVLTYDQKLNKVEPGRSYNGRVKLDKDTYSLTLKSLQKNDSGVYIARSIDEEGENPIVQYKLSVLDPVESPILTPVHHQLSSDSCNVTLTCSGHNLTIRSNCSSDVCEEKKIESPGGIILSMYVSGSTIICNHSNPVSWKKSAIKEIKEICFSIGTDKCLQTQTHTNMHPIL